MKIVVQVAHEVPEDAFARVQQVLDATQLHDISFNGCDLSAERSDFTCIEEGTSHSDAARLFSAVEDAIRNPFEHDPDGYLLVPVGKGGFMKVVRG